MINIRGASFSLLDYYSLSTDIEETVKAILRSRREYSAQHDRLIAAVSSEDNTHDLNREGLLALHRALTSGTKEYQDANNINDSGLPERIQQALNSLKQAFNTRQMLEEEFRATLEDARVQEKRSLRALLIDYHSQIENELALVPPHSPHHRTQQIIARMIHNLERERVKPSRYYPAVKAVLRITTKTNVSPTCGWSGIANVLSQTPNQSRQERGVPVARRVREPGGPIATNALETGGRSRGSLPAAGLITTPWPAEKIVKISPKDDLPSISSQRHHRSNKDSVENFCVWRVNGSPQNIGIADIPDSETLENLRKFAPNVRVNDALEEFKHLMALTFRHLYGDKQIPYLKYLYDLQQYTTVNTQTRATPLAETLRRSIRYPSSTVVGATTNLFNESMLEELRYDSVKKYQVSLIKGDHQNWIMTEISAKHIRYDKMGPLEYSISADFGYPPNARRRKADKRILYPYTEEYTSDPRDDDLTLEQLHLRYTRGQLLLCNNTGHPILLREQLPVDARIIPLAARIMDALFAPAASCKVSTETYFSPCDEWEKRTGLRVKSVRHPLQEGTVTILRKAWRVELDRECCEGILATSVVDALVGWEHLGLPGSFYYRPATVEQRGVVADSRTLFCSVKLISTFELFWRELESAGAMEIEVADPDPVLAAHPLTELTVDIHE